MDWLVYGLVDGFRRFLYKRIHSVEVHGITDSVIFPVGTALIIVSSIVGFIILLIFLFV